MIFEKNESPKNSSSPRFSEYPEPFKIAFHIKDALQETCSAACRAQKPYPNTTVHEKMDCASLTPLTLIVSGACAQCIEKVQQAISEDETPIPSCIALECWESDPNVDEEAILKRLEKNRKNRRRYS